MKKTFKVVLVSWNKAHSLAKKLIKKINKSNYKPNVIIGIGRGGYVPARIISDYLLIKNLAYFRIQHYWLSAAKSSKAIIKQPLNIKIKDKKILLVDDITDTGFTLIKACNYIKKFKPKEIKTAVLEHKITSKFQPDFYAHKIIKWHWVTYPWALHEDIVDLISRIYKKGMNIKEIKQKLKNNFKIDIELSDIENAIIDVKYF